MEVAGATDGDDLGARSRETAEALNRWIARAATESDDADGLIERFCTALREAGLPLWRMSASAPAIDPTVRGFSLNWVAGEGASFSLAPHSDRGEPWLRSPIYALLQAERTTGRWRLDAPAPADGDLPLLEELRASGGTDYVLHLIAFAPGTALRGVGLSFVTKDQAGFSSEHLALIDSVLPALGLAMCKFSLTQTLRKTLKTYLGHATSGRVLDGQIRRGEGQTISAAILLIDLRGFTALTDREPPAKVVGWLDEHFEALGEPVAQHGGEILKFLGDGFLAVFPVSDVAAMPCQVCTSALQSARDAEAANHALNARRSAAGLPTLDAAIVLHFGEVVYGNVGTTRRLDFTTIGRAVNEASRIEKLCGDLACTLLLSDTFAARCGCALRDLGSWPLRGLNRPQRLWTVAQDGEGAA